MKLRITVPTALVGAFDDVVHVRAEDASGAFGILQRHADFLTVPETSVVSWRRAGGTEGHCAVRGGVLAVRGGGQITIATREAVLGDDLVHLEVDVLEAFRQTTADEQSSRAGAARLQLAAPCRILDYLRPERTAGARLPRGLGGREPRP